MALLSLLSKHSEIVAPRLLGCLLEREINGQKITVKIVETESYHQSDVASHSYNGMTKRTEVMFGPPGHLYVYFTYGMHYCANIVTGEQGEGSAVLIRAVEPISGTPELIKRRSDKTGVDLTNGPAKLCQALSINTSLNGHDLHNPPLQLLVQDPLSAEEIIAATRIGISKGKDVPWRFYIKDNPYVSKP